jgi:hypothetical protein
VSIFDFFMKSLNHWLNFHELEIAFSYLAINSFLCCHAVIGETCPTFELLVGIILSFNKAFYSYICTELMEMFLRRTFSAVNFDFVSIGQSTTNLERI